MPGSNADIEIGWYPTLAGAAATLARAVPPGLAPPLPIVPASLRHDDPTAAAVRSALRDRGLRTVTLVPRPPAALLVPRGAAWQAATIDGHRWRLDARLARSPWVALATVDARHRRGPFALDLPARFLHPADRVRLAARPDRLRALADVAAVAPPAACLVVTPVGAGWLAVTTRDPIAAELWALALAERHHDAALEMQGPWEEPAVQRATELGLGIRIPDDMRITVEVPASVSVARSLLRETAERLGYTLDARRAADSGHSASFDDDM
jgi:hypothetical protein